MGSVDYIDYLANLTGGYITEIDRYFNTIIALRKAYLAFSSLLLILNVAKIGLNLFNLGDFVPNPPAWAKGINITISILEGLFMFGFSAIFVAFMYYVWFLIFFYFIPAFGIALVSLF